jgi:hypothetical protein
VRPGKVDRMLSNLSQFFWRVPTEKKQVGLGRRVDIDDVLQSGSVGCNSFVALF